MENIFTEVKNRLSIKDVIEHYSTATFNKDSKCQCPFPDHQDVKNPSLSILRDNNTFRCFGCDKSGSVVDFVMMYKGVDKIQAVNMLNEDFNLIEKLKPCNYYMIEKLYCKIMQDMDYEVPFTIEELLICIKNYPKSKYRKFNQNAYDYVKSLYERLLYLYPI